MNLLQWILFNRFVKVATWMCQLFFVFLAKQNQAEVWPRFQSLLKLLLKVLNESGFWMPRVRCTFRSICLEPWFWLDSSWACKIRASQRRVERDCNVDSTAISTFVVMLVKLTNTDKYKYSICHFNQHNYKYWDGSAV